MIARARVSEHGSISIAALAFIFAVMVFCLGVADAGFFLAARYKAQNAADAAALAAAQESFPLLGTGCAPGDAARKMAAANNATLETIAVDSGGGRVQVTVSVRAPSLLLRKLGIRADEARAAAAAEVDIEALLSSGVIWSTASYGLLSRISPHLQSRCRDSAGASTMVSLLALSHLGKPYAWGAAGPGRFDCSGLVYYVYGQVGVRLPRVTFDQVRCGRAVAPCDLAPGDLVFFRGNAHVGIYIGGGWFVHAPCTGQLVKLCNLNSRSDLSACRRLL